MYVCVCVSVYVGMYIHRLLYQSFMVTTHWKSTIDNTHTEKKKESKHNINITHQITREEIKRRREKNVYKNKSKTINKIGLGTWILIITLNINKLNTPTKSHRLAEEIQNQGLYICCLQEAEELRLLVLDKTLESPLDCKEIQRVHPKEN